MASIFTKIINREIPAHIVYEDEKTMAFLDIRPAQPGHMLVVPKAEIDQFQDLDNDTYQAVMATVKLMAERIKDKLHVKRVGVIIYGFDVPHVHVHVIPMPKPGLISIRQPAQPSPPEELAQTAQQLTDN